MSVTVIKEALARCLGIGLLVSASATFVYATGQCCAYTYSVTGEGGGPVCSTSNATTRCETGSPDSIPGAKSTGYRNAVCTKYTSTQWYSGSCTTSPGTGWSFVGVIPGSDPVTCCWAYLPSTQTITLPLQVDKCYGDPCLAED
jgi:hypothetical protein